MSAPRSAHRQPLRTALLALALCRLPAPLSAAAEDPARARIEAGQALEAHWHARAMALQEKVEIAREQLAAAEKDYELMRALNHPRGAGKRAVIRRVEDATYALAEARQQRARFEAAADAAGVPRSWLEPRRGR